MISISSKPIHCRAAVAFTSSSPLHFHINTPSNVTPLKPLLMLAKSPQAHRRPSSRRALLAGLLAATISIVSMHQNIPPTYAQHLTHPTSTAQLVLSQDPKDEPSLGEKIGARLQKLGWSDEAVVFAVSALPIIESRGGVPIACLLGMPPLKTLGIVFAGNMTPIALLFGLMKLEWVQRLNRFFLDRARDKILKMGSETSRLLGLILFVGIPLPGTGAYTGSLMAFVMELSFVNAMLTLGVGVLMSEVIMITLCKLGTAGAVVAGVSLLGIGAASIVKTEQSRRAVRGVGEAEPLNPGPNDIQP